MIAEACLYVVFQRVEMSYSDHQLSCNAERAKPGRPWHALPVEQTRELIWGPLSNNIPSSSKQFGETDCFFESEAALGREIGNHGWVVCGHCSLLAV